MSATILDFVALAPVRRRARKAAALVAGTRVRLPHNRGVWLVVAPPERGRAYLRLVDTNVTTFAFVEECRIVGAGEAPSATA